MFLATAMLLKSKFHFILLVMPTLIFIHYILLIIDQRMEKLEALKKSREFFTFSQNDLLDSSVFQRNLTDIQFESNFSSFYESSTSNSFHKNRINQLHNSTFPGARNYSEYILNQQPQFRSLLDAQPLRTNFGLVINDVTNFRYRINIPPFQNPNVGIIGLCVVVISSPSNFKKRDVIRKTWLGQLKQIVETESSIKTYRQVKLMGHAFVVGFTSNKAIQRRIEEESEKNGDILQVDMVDAYSNLTLKVVYTLNWINNQCERVHFVLKVDDDVYVNIRTLFLVLKTFNSSQQYVYGTSADGIVRRDGKFSVSVDLWPWSNYPPYSMGAFLLMTGCTVEPLLAAAQTTPYFPFEDTYIGLCAEKAGVQFRFSQRALAGLLTRKPQPCFIHHSISWLTQSVDVTKISHMATNDLYKNVTNCKQIWKELKDPNKL